MTRIIIVILLATIAFLLGRLSARGRVRVTWRVPLNRLLWAVTAALIAVNSTGLTAYVITQNTTLVQQNECRADLAAPVNDATARLTSGQARGTLVFLAQALDDPAVTKVIHQRFGVDDSTVLRSQALAIIKASDDLDRANKQRSTDPVERCK